MKKEGRKVNNNVSTGQRSMRRLQGQLFDYSLKHGKKVVVHGILSGVIQELDPQHYSEVMKCIIKAVFTSNNEKDITNLIHSLARGVDYILKEESCGLNLRDDSI